MSNDLIPPGYYRARAVKHDNVWAQFGRTSTSKHQLLMIFEITEDGPHKGTRLPWFGFFTDATWERTMESLRFCGFEGDDLARLNAQTLDREVAVKVEHNENPSSGKVYARVGFVNALGSGIQLSDPLSDAEVRQFAAMMKRKIGGAGGNGAVASSSKRTSDPYAGANIPPPTDDDLNF